jgi:hypothetical protein
MDAPSSRPETPPTSASDPWTEPWDAAQGQPFTEICPYGFLVKIPKFHYLPHTTTTTTTQTTTTTTTTTQTTTTTTTR